MSSSVNRRNRCQHPIKLKLYSRCVESRRKCRLFAVVNPATAQVIGRGATLACLRRDAAAQAAQAALWLARYPSDPAYSIPVQIQNLLEENFGISHAPSPWRRARLWMKPGVRCAGQSKTSRSLAVFPLMMLGDISEDIAQGIDELMIRQRWALRLSLPPSTSPA